MQQARERLDRPGVELAPRKMWPSGMADLGVEASGKLTADELTEPGRAVGRLTDIGRGNRLRDLLGPAAVDQQLPEDLFQSCVQVLAAWEWSRRPVGVVAIGSRTRPVLTRSIAERIAAVGRLPLLGEVVPDPNAAPPRPSNSAQRVAALWNRFRLPDDLAERLPGLDGPVLLVDDLADTGWTSAVVGRALRRAGAPAVLPFALATTG